MILLKNEIKTISKNRKKKKEELIKSRLTFKKNNFKFEETNQIITKTIIKIINQISENKIYKKEKIEKVIFIRKCLLFCDLIILLLISTIFKTNCKNSTITLKVSQNGAQKLCYSGTQPNEIWIDDIMQQYKQNSYNLTPSNIVKLIWTNDITNCHSMFKECRSIIEMNFTNFDATKCTSTNLMFMNCTSLISLDLSGFITSNYLNDMPNMFWDCKSLISLNLSTFDTSNVTSFGHLFSNCESLKWIDISNFKTEKVLFMDNMFIGCKSLTSVNLSNFITSKVITIDYMFSGCESLKIIDFSNLDVSKDTYKYIREFILKLFKFGIYKFEKFNIKY